MTDSRVEFLVRLARPLDDDELDPVVDRVNDLVDADAVYSDVQGVVHFAVGAETTGRTPIDAAIETVRCLRQLDVPVAWVDSDLVDLTEIAERCDVSHEASRKWATRSDFPTPAGVFAGGGRIWDWTDINRWLALTGKRSDSGYLLDTGERARVNSAIIEMQESAVVAAIREFRPWISMESGGILSSLKLESMDFTGFPVHAMGELQRAFEMMRARVTEAESFQGATEPEPESESRRRG